MHGKCHQSDDHDAACGINPRTEESSYVHVLTCHFSFCVPAKRAVVMIMKGVGCLPGLFLFRRSLSYGLCLTEMKILKK